MCKKRYSLFLLLLIVAGYIIGCNKKWDDHNRITDPSISNNLYQAIRKNVNLTKFSDLLVKSGYDKVLAASKSYTVWAPSNSALATLDTAIINDPLKLKAFVGNHIANLSYPTGSPDQRVPMLNGKYILFSGNKFDSANIINANLYSKNGVYHIIDKFIPRKDNCWEFVNNSTDYTLFKSALISLNYTFFDSTKATQIATDPLTGNPIWDSTNAKVIRNSFLDNVLNIADETNEYTLIVLTDGSFTNEFNKITPWFQTRTGNIDSSNNLASYHLIKDLAISGSKSMAQLPDTLVSKFGVKIPIDKSKIVASYKTSNGYVHVMSQVDFNLTDKFPPIIIQGENPTSFATTDRSFYTYYRTRTNPNTGVIFKDILMQNYGFTNYFIRYSIPAVPAMRYNVSWVAVNDVQTKPLWTQRLAIGNISDTTFIADTIAYKNYSEVPLGQFQLDSYRNRLNLFLIGTSSSSTSGGTNSISLDYIKLTPAF